MVRGGVTAVSIVTWCYRVSSPTVHKEHPFRDDTQLFYQFSEKKSRPRSDSVPAYAFKLLGGISSHFLGVGPSPTVLGGDGEVGSRLANGRPRSASSVASSPRSSRSSLSSILDECFDTIAQLGPEVLIYATLNKEPSERTEEDIELVYEELLNVRAFRHLSNAVKRELAACVRLEHYKKAGKFCEQFIACRYKENVVNVLDSSKVFVNVVEEIPGTADTT